MAKNEKCLNITRIDFRIEQMNKRAFEQANEYLLTGCFVTVNEDKCVQK